MTDEEAKFCAHCGANLPSGSSFCPECGSSVSGGANPYRPAASPN
ncbi:MAG: zinc-ribbon domain-containing protein, partial [Candidatus Methanomethylophilaceae archaeon]